MPTGKYKGTAVSVVPDGYLRRLVAHRGPCKSRDMAKEELERRGSLDFPNIEITGHAIDRASLRLGYVWADTSNPEEGIMSWLARMAEEALSKYKRTDQRSNVRVHHKGICFVFELKYITPMLMSVWLTKFPKED